MRIGVPTETKVHEYRVAITPAGVHALTSAGHEVLVQSGAGRGSSISDDEFREAGARIAPSARQVWDGADLVCKVKEPVEGEYGFLRPGLILFAYLHLAADARLTRALLDARVTAVAYETVRAGAALPLLAPMSEVAGRLAAQVGAVQLQRPAGGTGVLMGGVPGTPPARVVVLGAGTVGRHAAQIATGMRADVQVLDISLEALRAIDVEFGGAVRTIASSAWEVERAVRAADLVIGAVLVPGARAPRLVSNELVATMRPGSVLVDVAVDQGGCFADTRATTHESPTYRVHGSTFYAVANMPGAVPATSTRALTNATLPYLATLADAGDAAARDAAAGATGDLLTALAVEGVPHVVRLRSGLRTGLSTHDGELFSDGVALAHGLALSERAG